MLNAIGSLNNRLAFDARVLVVDDEPTMRILNTACLKMCAKENGDNDFHVDEEATFDEAIGKLNSGAKYDLLITDGSFPTTYGSEPMSDNGIKLVKAAKEKQSPIPTIMISGERNEDFINKVKAEGSYFIKKPYEVAKFLQVAAEKLYSK
ncbi:MAG: hypothetical protein A2Y25_06250 [Candidatus Melainabacteria bacterium GWF2_37_15]|nr:MAG: hypothetical protein A2Y25_06250 [Candidatus Melainabacteria bacterium GWF2_37_15]